MLEESCHVRVDEYGFFIYWTSVNKVGGCRITKMYFELGQAVVIRIPSPVNPQKCLKTDLVLLGLLI